MPEFKSKHELKAMHSKYSTIFKIMNLTEIFRINKLIFHFFNPSHFISREIVVKTYLKGGHILTLFLKVMASGCLYSVIYINNVQS